MRRPSRQSTARHFRSTPAPEQPDQVWPSTARRSTGPGAAGPPVTARCHPAWQGPLRRHSVPPVRIRTCGHAVGGARWRSDMATASPANSQNRWSPPVTNQPSRPPAGTGAGLRGGRSQGVAVGVDARSRRRWRRPAWSSPWLLSDAGLVVSAWRTPRGVSVDESQPEGLDRLLIKPARRWPGRRRHHDRQLVTKATLSGRLNRCGSCRGAGRRSLTRSPRPLRETHRTVA